MKQIRKTAYILIACVLFIKVTGQHTGHPETGYPFLKNYTTGDYHAHTQNFAVAQDRHGIMYFGNFAGILQFDGASWRLIETEKISRVTALASDESGRIYAGARGELGLLEPDQAGNLKFRSLLPDSLKGILFRDITDIYCHNETTYFISDRILFILQNGVMDTWKPDTEIIAGYFVRDRLFLQIRGTGLTFFNNGTVTPVKGGEEFNEAIRIMAMLPYPGNRILIATGSQGLYALEENLQVVDIFTRSDPFFLENLITDAVMLQDSTYAFGTSRQGIIITGQTGEVIQVINRESGLVNEYVHALHVADDNLLWVALNNGIAAIETPGPFSVFDERKNLTGGISGIVRHRGKIVVSTYEGVYSLDHDKGYFVPVREIITASWSLLNTGQELLAATTQGLYKIDPPGARLLMADLCMALAASHGNPSEIYIGRTDGLYRSFKRDNAWQTMLIAKTDEEIRWMVSDRHGTLWGVTVSGRILSVRNNQTIHYYDTTSGLPQISGHFLNLIRGNLVVSSSNGLYQWDQAAGQFSPTSLKIVPEIPGQSWFSYIAEDAAGNLWITEGDDKNIAFYRNSGQGYIKISEPYLPIADIPIQAIYPDDEGVTWLGGPHGLIRYRKDVKGISTVMRPAMIRKITAGADSVIFGGDSGHDNHQAHTVPLTLPYAQNSLAFEFAAPYFSARGDILYSWNLEGFEDTWSDWTTITRKEYTNLHSGKYTFRVRAKNLYHQISQDARFTFVIQSPWYRKWYAYIFYTFLAGGLVWLIVVFRNRQLVREKQVLEKTISDRTAEVVQQKEEIEKQSAELTFKNEELEKINRVVKAINSEIHFQNLLQSLLEKIRMIRAVENSAALVFDKDLNLFRFTASFGWDVQRLEQVHLTLDQAEQRYISGSEEVYEDIFLKRDFSNFTGIPALDEMELPRSMLILVIRVENKVEAFLILENMTREEAFKEQDLNFIRNSKEHIISAFIKTRILADLQSTLNNLKETQDQLIQSEKLASLGQLTAGIAHEIQNPLNFVNNFSALSVELADELKGYAEEVRDLISPETAGNIFEVVEMIRGNVQKINEHGKRAASIVKGMLQHSRGKSGEFELTDINNLVTEYVNLAYHGMRAKDKSFNTSLKTQLDPAVEKAMVVPQDLSRVILNIVNNACYAVDEKSRKGISGYAPEVLTTTKKTGDRIEIRIRDNGTGIPQHVLEKIFNPFFTTKPTGKGTGLGLSMSFDIITQIHKGKLEVQSKDGEFTEFIIIIPEKQ